MTDIEWDWRRAKKISTLEELLVALTPSHWAVGAQLDFCARWKQMEAQVVVSQDCNYYYTTDHYPVPREIAAEAVARGFVRGIPQWGYTSDSEWKISDLGREEARRIRKHYEDQERTEQIKIVNQDNDPGDE